MKKKGFTLVELMAVIILLGVIAIIAYPTITGTVGSSKEKAYEETIRQIEQAANRYGLDNTNVLPKTDGIFDTTITLEQLIKSGYLQKTENGKLYNPIDSSEMTGCVDIKYDTEYSQYIYTYDDACAPQEILEYANYYVNYGGQYNDGFYDGITTSDGGYVAVGESNSSSINNLTNYNQNLISNDAIIVKYDSTGKIVFEKTFGGTGNDSFEEVIEIEEDGKNYYIVIGNSTSNDHDLADTQDNNKGFILKYDESGNLVDKRIYLNVAYFYGIDKASDGYVIVGCIGDYNNKGDVGEIYEKSKSDYYQYDDSLILKIDNDFEIEWSNIFGGNVVEEFYDVINTSTGYVAIGRASSLDGDMTDIKRHDGIWVYDAIIVSYDKDGNVLKKNAFGSSLDDAFNSVIEINNGYIAVGFANAADIDLASKGSLGAVIVKYNTNLELVDYIVLGQGQSKKILNNNGQIIVASSILNSNNYNDGYINIIDNNLNIMKTQKFDGGNNDAFNDIEITSSGYVTFGSTYSKGSSVYDVIDPYSKGNKDAFMVSYDSNLNLKKSFMKKVELLNAAPILVKNYGTSIPSYENLDTLELYTTNNPSKDIKNWCNLTENNSGLQDNYKYISCLKPFNGSDILELYNFTNSYGVSFVENNNDYIMNKNLDKVNLSDMWFNLHLYYHYTISDLKLIFNGNKYTIRECVANGYIEPLVIHGYNMSDSYEFLLVDNSNTVLDGSLSLNDDDDISRVNVYFKTKVSGFQGVSLTFNGTPDNYRNLMISAYRNFDISLTKSE